MKLPALLSLTCASLLLAGCQAPAPRGDAARITVEFKDPDHFRDVRDSLGGPTDNHALAALQAYLQENAPAYLAAGQKLRVTFTDIDLAGDFAASGGGRYDRVRVIRGIYIPRQEFTFQVTDAAGAVVREGKRTLTDLNFQANGTRLGSDQPYFYDKILLEDWLRKEFR